MRLYPNAQSKSLLLNLFLTVLAFSYALVMCWLLFYRNRYFGEGYSYNLVPFFTIKKYIVYHDHFNFDIWFKNLFGNIVLFMPIGLFLPLLNKKYSRGIVLAAASILLITIVELTQMLTRVGSFDIDDIILNTLGALLGLMMTKYLVR
ncbi:VanZ family protein [Candidatus Pristimantibacillus sp. PTI5]|uniref:VanZ family protein n=1 Tax=Candidatus Pristimantibacillus sp. PTI5 TaxID=3400422 RepID=UPI003B028555